MKDGKKPDWRELRHHVIAGVGAGSMTSLITCPLDVVKTRMQYLPIYSDSRLKDLSENIASDRPYRGTLISLRRIWLAEGVQGLYRGLGPTLIGYLPTYGIYFPAYHNYKYEISRLTSRPPTDPFVHILSAMAAGATSSLFTNPLWLIRTRLMTQSSHTPYFYRNTWDALKTVYRNEGFLGLYKGITPAALGLLHVAVQFPLYEELKQIQRKDPSNLNEVLSPYQILIASTLSKIIASTVTYPHEVLRTRFQNQTTKTPKYRSLRHAIKTIWVEEGWKGFYRGIGATVMRVVPASAVTFISYEWILQKCRKLP